MKNIARSVEMAANIAIICVAVLLGAVLISRTITNFRSTATAESANSETSTNQKLQLTGVDWSKHDNTLVMAISSTCHFCTSSAEFYQQIKARTPVHTIAVLPQTVEESRDYLKGIGVQVDEVMQASLNSIDVSGTPTLLLVDREGKILRKWIGKLPPVEETEVLLALGATG